MIITTVQGSRTVTQQRNGDLEHPVISAVLATAATLLDMEVVFLGGVNESTFSFEQLHGTWAGITAGDSVPLTDSFCHRLLGGAAPHTSDAAEDPDYRDVPARTNYEITSYVGVPVIGPEGAAVATLCGIDHDHVSVDESTIGVLNELAAIISAHLRDRSTEGLVVRRTPAGWQVGGVDEAVDDLTTAMSLADLMTTDLNPNRRPERPAGELDEVASLRLAVTQLEHALTARVLVEQAIGVLAERQHTSPRTAFERLRRVARSRGRKVHDLAKEVVASSHAPGVPLPPELAGHV